MSHQFELLPIELQASVVELRGFGAPADAIDRLITRTMAALGVKSNKVQVEVWQMENRLSTQIAHVGDKLQADHQTRYAKAQHELDDWRGRIEVALTALAEFRVESSADRLQIRDAVAAQAQQFDDLIAQFRAIVARLDADTPVGQTEANRQAHADE